MYCVMQIEVLESKVVSLREGSVLVTPEERLEVQRAYDHKLGLWRRRKKIYQELWGMITESMTESLKDLKVPILFIALVLHSVVKRYVKMLCADRD